MSAVDVDSKPLAVRMVDMQNEAKATGKPMNYAGLQILDGIDGLYIKQEWEILEQLSSWFEARNEYTIFDQNAKVKLFKAKEKTCCCWRICCGENRPFRIKVYDHTGAKDKLAMLFKRKYRCCGFAPLGCNHRVDVHYMVDQNNNTISSESKRTKVAEVSVPCCHGGCCFPTWHVRDRAGQVQASINGPFCCVCDCCGSDFTITDGAGRKTGQISKLRPDSLKGMAMELVTDADNFKVSFDKDLDPTIKLAILAASIQVDFTFFEDKRGLCEGRCCDLWCCGYACPVVPKICCCCCASKHKKKNEKERRQGGPMEQVMTR